jgi:hypothetical protein
VIGYYIHHVGHGHLSRARAIATALGEPVTGLSSQPRPAAWRGDWVELARDDTAQDAAAVGQGGADAHHAAERLHWVPVGHEGLRSRMAAVSEWIARERPRVLVADVSVEIALLARLHGVPVVSVVLPGTRADEAHRLGFAVSSALIAAWPPAAAGMVDGLDEQDLARLEPVGAISSHEPIRPIASGSHGVRRVLVLGGAGGDDFTAAALEAARRETLGWQWDLIGGTAGRWVDDPWEHLLAADVVVTAAGQNGLAEVAAARRPAIVIPQDRPHDEQRHTGAVLAGAQWPALVVEGLPTSGWAALLERAAAQDAAGWADWNDGHGASRAAAVIRRVAGRLGRAA